MTKQPIQVYSVGAVFTLAFIGFVYAIGAKYNEEQKILSKYDNLPAYTLIERNMAADNAFFSIRLETAYAGQMRELTNYLVDSYVRSGTHKSATFFYYPKHSDFRSEEPMHQFTWHRRSGVSMDF